MAGQDPGEEVLEIFPSGPRLVLLNSTNPCKSLQISGQNEPKCSSSPAMARKSYSGGRESLQRSLVGATQLADPSSILCHGTRRWEYNAGPAICEVSIVW